LANLEEIVKSSGQTINNLHQTNQINKDNINPLDSCILAWKSMFVETWLTNKLLEGEIKSLEKQLKV
ncbi:hypothetical protein J1N35_034012, partial [Gossypium stocksii]